MAKNVNSVGMSGEGISDGVTGKYREANRAANEQPVSNAALVAVGIFGAALTGLVIAIVVYVNALDSGEEGWLQNLAHTGDFFTGVLGPLLVLLSLVVVAYALIQNGEILKTTRLMFEQSKQDSARNIALQATLEMISQRRSIIQQFENLEELDHDDSTTRLSYFLKNVVLRTILKIREEEGRQIGQDSVNDVADFCEEFGQNLQINISNEFALSVRAAMLFLKEYRIDKQDPIHALYRASLSSDEHVLLRLYLPISVEADELIQTLNWLGELPFTFANTNIPLLLESVTNGALKKNQERLSRELAKRGWRIRKFETI